MEHHENCEDYKGLTVNKGIEQPSSINPYLKLRRIPKKRRLSVAEYVEGIVKGKYGTSLALEKILQSEVLNLADVIVTSGRDGKFIPGLILGTVSSIDFSPSDTLKSAILKLDYNISEITNVFVLKSL